APSNYTISLHDALPICALVSAIRYPDGFGGQPGVSGKLLCCNPLPLARALTEYNPSLLPYAQRSACFVSAPQNDLSWASLAAGCCLRSTTVIAPAGLLGSEGGKREVVGSVRSAEQQSQSTSYRTSRKQADPEAKRLGSAHKKGFAIKRKEAPRPNASPPKPHTLDPRIKKALQSSARKLPIQQRHLHASHQRRSLRAQTRVPQRDRSISLLNRLRDLSSTEVTLRTDQHNISPTGLGGYIQILLLPFSTMRNEPVLCAVPGQKLTACYRLVQTWQIRFQRLFHGSYHHFYQSFSFHLLPLRMLADQWRHFVYTHLSGLLKKPFQPFNILGRRNGNVQVVLFFTIAGLNVGNLQHCPLR